MVRTLCRLTIASAVAALAVLSFADPRDLKRNDAIPIRIDQDLRVETTQPGDQFTAHVDGDRRLPEHTVFHGVVDRVYPANRWRAAAMDLEFTSIQTPDGAHFNIQAIPTRPDDPHLTRSGDGRVISGYQPGTEGAYVVGGAVGGAIVGSIARRPLAGTFIGALFGAIAGSADRHENQNLVIAKGAKLVAVLESDVVPGGTPLPPPPGLRYVSLRFNDRDISFDPLMQPYEVGQVVMAPVGPMADQLGLTVMDRVRGRVAIQGPEGRVLLFENSVLYRNNGINATLPRQVIRRNGVLYAPLEVFEALKGQHFAIKEN